MNRDEKRLRRILRVRRVQEESARAVWQTAERTARSIEDAATELRTEHTRAAAELARPGASMDAAWIVTAHGVLDAFGGRVAVAEQRAADARKRADMFRAPWLERRRDAQGISRLSDRAYAASRREEHKRECAEMDERAMQRRNDGMEAESE